MNRELFEYYCILTIIVMIGLRGVLYVVQYFMGNPVDLSRLSKRLTDIRKSPFVYGMRHPFGSPVKLSILKDHKEKSVGDHFEKVIASINKEASRMMNDQGLRIASLSGRIEELEFAIQLHEKTISKHEEEILEAYERAVTMFLQHMNENPEQDPHEIGEEVMDILTNGDDEEL